MKKHLLKLSSFASMPLVSLAAISCSNNQNIPPRDYEMIDQNYGLAFNSGGKITKYYYFSDNGNSYENIVIPEYLENNRILTSQYYGYKQRITRIRDFVFSAEEERDPSSGKWKPKYNDYAQYLTSITLPNSIEIIGAGAFYRTPLTQIVLPDSVIDIGFEAFFYCENLESVKLSKNTKYIGSGTFRGTAITSIEIPDSVLYIYYDAFRNTKLNSPLYIPDSVLLIDSRAFEGTQITSVSIPKNCQYEANSFPSGCKIEIRE